MCVNYAPVQRQVLRDIFGVEPPRGPWKEEAWPDYPAPIIRISPDGVREAVIGTFSMVPRSKIAPGTRYFPTANARIETIGKLNSFARHWQAGQLCLIPATALYEPNWETGKAVRWKIALSNGEPFAVAGLWSVARRHDLIHDADDKCRPSPIDEPLPQARRRKTRRCDIAPRRMARLAQLPRSGGGSALFAAISLRPADGGRFAPAAARKQPEGTA